MRFKVAATSAALVDFDPIKPEMTIPMLPLTFPGPFNMCPSRQDPI